ncbi:MAG: hypothetical protein QW705_02270 [Zestosphaera sp.]
MRVERGSKVYLMGRYLDESCVVEEMLGEGVRKSSYVLLKPLSAQVRVRGITLRLGIPAASLITESPLSCREPDLVLEEDAWAEAKHVIESDGVRFSGEFTIGGLQFLRMLRSDSQEGSLCDVFDSEGGLEPSEYLSRLINVRHVLITRSLKSVQPMSVRGYLKSYWTTHYILSGLELPAREVTVRDCLSVEDVPKLRLLMKPLLSVDEHVLLGELPLNRSVVINGILEDRYRDLFLEILIRAVLYTC